MSFSVLRLRVDLNKVDLFRDTINLMMPSTSDIKKAMVLDHYLFFWAEVHDQDKTEGPRRIKVFRTGEKFSEADYNRMSYIDTVVAQETDLHLYEDYTIKG